MSPPPVQRLGPAVQCSPPTVQDPKRKRQISDDVASDSNTDELTLISIANIIAALNTNISSVKDTVASVKDELKSEFANLSTTVRDLSDKQYDLMKENLELKAEIASVRSEVVNLRAEVSSKEEIRSKEMEAEIAARDDLEAQQRRYNLTISGIVKQRK